MIPKSPRYVIVFLLLSFSKAAVSQEKKQFYSLIKFSELLKLYITTKTSQQIIRIMVYASVLQFFWFIFFEWIDITFYGKHGREKQGGNQGNKIKRIRLNKIKFFTPHYILFQSHDKVLLPPWFFNAIFPFIINFFLFNNRINSRLFNVLLGINTTWCFLVSNMYYEISYLVCKFVEEKLLIEGITSDQLSTLLRMINYIPTETLNDDDFFEILCTFNTLDLIEQNLNSKKIYKKHREYLRKACLEFRVKNHVAGDLVQDINRCIEAIKKTDSKFNINILIYLLKHAELDDFTNLVDTILNSEKNCSSSLLEDIFSAINNTSKIKVILEKVKQRKIFHIIDAKVIKLIIETRALSQWDRINWILEFLDIAKIHQVQIIVPSLLGTDEIRQQIIQKYSEIPDNAVFILKNCKASIFKNYIENGDILLYNMLEMLVARCAPETLFESNIVYNEIATAILSTNFSKQNPNNINLTVDKTERTIKLLQLLCQNSNDTISQKETFRKFYKEAKKSSNKTLAQYIKLISGKSFTINILKNSNSEFEKNIESLFKKIDKNNAQENCNLFFELYTQNYSQWKDTFVQNVCSKTPTESVTLFIKTIQRLLLTDLAFHERYFDIAPSIMNRICKYSTYKQNTKVMYGHWLRKTVKNYRIILGNSNIMPIDTLYAWKIFNYIVYNANEIDYSCSGSKIHYNVFDEIVMTAEPNFFTIIVSTSLLDTEKKSIVPLLPFHLIAKQKADLPALKQNLELLEDKMLEFKKVVLKI